MTIVTAHPRRRTRRCTEFTMGLRITATKPATSDHQQDVPHPVGELARQVDGDHHAAGGEDRRKRNAPRRRGGPQPRLVARTGASAAA